MSRLISKKSKRKFLFLTSLLIIIASCIWLYDQIFIDKNKEARVISIPKPLKISDADRKFIVSKCEDWYAKNMDKETFNGGVLIAKDGNIVFERYRGEIELGSGMPLTDSTPIHIASVSKTFTAMAVLYLYQLHKIELDDAFAKYFPTFPYPGVTIKNMLNHRSGLPNYTHFMDSSGWDKSKMLSNQDVLHYMIAHKSSIPNITPPGTHFSYCNSNYALLALLIEKVSGENYPEFLKHHFFDPLQMHHSFVRSESTEKSITPNYQVNGKAFKDNYLDKVYGDKNIYSTPRDLLIWDRVLRTHLLFDQNILEMAYTPYSQEKKGTRNYGLGWRLMVEDGGDKLIYHNGWWHGNNAAFIRTMSSDGTIIVLGSRFNKAVYTAKELVGLFDKRFEISEEE